MLVFWKEKLVILAVPKTGSTALAMALGPHASMQISDPPIFKHAPVYRYERFLKPMFEKAGKQSMEVLAVMREPVDWLGSWYRYRRRPFMDGHPNSTAQMSFDDFVQAYMAEPRPDVANVGSQHRFLVRKDGSIGADHLFRYQDQAALKAFLEDRLSMEIALPRANVSPQMELSLDPGIEAELRARLAPEFELWNRVPAR